MNKELVYLLEPDTGRVTVEASQVSTLQVDELASDLGMRVNINCAKPAENKRPLPLLRPQGRSLESGSDNSSIWVYQIYHNSVVDGPGRRSVVQVSGCSIRCQGCFVPQTHERENGMLISINSIVNEIMVNREVHDGVTLLGGEPFDQPGAVAELISRLKRCNFHIAIYSGYVLEDLIQRKTPSIDYILTHIDLLIDGPFVANLRDGAGEYRGSRNQKLVAL